MGAIFSKNDNNNNNNNKNNNNKNNNNNNVNKNNNADKAKTEAEKPKPNVPAQAPKPDNEVEKPKPKQNEEEKKNDEVKDVHDEIELPLPNVSYLEKRTKKLKNDLELLKEKYKETYAPLIKREWVQVQPKNINAKDVTVNNSLKVLQFNMLADGLSGVYFKKTNAKSFLGIDTRCMEWTYRGLRVLEVILENKSDIICLQECDGLPFMKEYLEKEGYDVVFQPKTLSPILQVTEELRQDRNDPNIQLNLDGVVIIYKKDRLQIIQDKIIHIDMKNNKEKVNALAVPFKFKINKNKSIEIFVITTHPKSTKDEDGEKLRVRQLKLMLNDIIKSEAMENKFVIMCTDLNSAPVVHDKGYPPLCYNYLMEEYKFLSSYRIVNEKNFEPPFTTLKKRENRTDRTCLDYIFIKNNDENLKFDVIGYLKMPDCENSVLLPNWFYPSDHFALVTEFAFQ